MRSATFLLLTVLPAAAAVSAGSGSTVWLASLDLSKVKQGWGKPQVDKAVTEVPMSIAGRKFEHGLGTHASSVIYIDTKGGCERFLACVGVDDNAKDPRGSVVFKVIGDGKMLFRSPVMKTGDQPLQVDVNLKGVKTLVLLAEPTADGIAFDHADWAEARFEITGDRPETMDRPREDPIILTPKPSPKPRINGPKVFGVRPGSPFIFTIPAAGDRPMVFSAENLPEGLGLDAAAGKISGSLTKRGEYHVTLKARNALGVASRPLRIVVGDAIALTPPMGWNSWYCYMNEVTEKDIRDAADAMVSSGMINHGYCYVDVDDCWMVYPGSDDPVLGGEPRSPDGALRPNKRFTDMKAMADYIHSKGLKAGLYISPGPRTCGGFEGSWGREELDARTFAEWGYDLLKYDFCSYGSVWKGDSLEEHKKPYKLMGDLLRKQNRDIVFNLCQYGMANVWEWGAEVGGNSWRTTGDLGATNDLWANVCAIGFSQNGLEKWAGPGHWNDPDYLLIGWIHWDGAIRPTPLTPNEQYTHVSLWSLLAAPLILSGDMRHLDDFTLSLLTNDEVIEVNQDPLGKQARRVAQDDELEVWAKDMEDGSNAVGLFNRGELESVVTAKWSDLGLAGKRIVRDLWRQKDLGVFEGRFETKVPRHGVVLVRIRAAEQRQEH